MSILGGEIETTLLPGMSLPSELARLFEWIEAKGFFLETPNGRIGSLFDEEAVRRATTDSEREGGTWIQFAAEGNVHLHHWFGHDRAEVLDRLYVFASTGGDGSMAAFWLDDDGVQRIVHLGSGSGSTLVCVLAEEPVDFLRLIAVGYDEICWQEELTAPPSTSGNFVVRPNEEFRAWVADTFDATIPRCGTEIVEHPDNLGDETSEDRFNRWVARSIA